jgi:hypothetical protein
MVLCLHTAVRIPHVTMPQSTETDSTYRLEQRDNDCVETDKGSETNYDVSPCVCATAVRDASARARRKRRREFESETDEEEYASLFIHCVLLSQSHAVTCETTTRVVGRSIYKHTCC